MKQKPKFKHPGGTAAYDTFQHGKANFDHFRTAGISTSQILRDSYHPHGRSPEDPFYSRIKARLAVDTYLSKIHDVHVWYYIAFGLIAGVILPFTIYLAITWNSYLLFGLWGLLQGLLIMRESHSASHFSFPAPKYAHWNQWVQFIAFSLVGTSHHLWRDKHIIRHHPHTMNLVDDIDADTIYPIKRVHKNQPKMPHHSYQHLYVWLLYAFTILFWSFSDLWQVITTPAQYSGKERLISAIELILHVGILYALPLSYGCILGLLIRTITTSLFFAIQFVVNHETLRVQQAIAQFEPGTFQGGWSAWQVLTSTDILSLKSPRLGWWMTQLSGGLNLQVTHHLFPGIHFSHYPYLSRIIREEWAAFRVGPDYPDFHHYNHLGSALVDHWRLLRNMSKT